MNTKFFLKIAAVAAAAALSATANAAVVDFNNLTSNTNSYVLVPNDAYVSGALTFTGTSYGAGGDALLIWGTGSSADADPLGATLIANYFGAPITVTSSTGAFTLNSFDLADTYNSGAATKVTFNWADASGAHSQLLQLDGNVGLQTFALGLQDVTSFSLAGYATTTYQLDNVVYNTSAVPEPASMGLMLAGLALVGATLRRRKS